MTMELGAALVETTAGWETEVPPAWANLLQGVTLDAASKRLKIPHTPWTPIFPTFFKSGDHDRQLLGAPEHAHTFRALQQIRPEDVRVVVIGQILYPDVAKAMGQSFEQGDLKDWISDAGRVASSLRPILQCAAADATGDSGYLAANAGWMKVVADLASKKIILASPRDLFARYNNQGVLWLNTTLTISLFKSSMGHQEAHAAFWRPFIDSILAGLTAMAGAHGLVFALWGTWAKGFEKGIVAGAKKQGTEGRVLFSKASHPVNADFLDANRLTDINAQIKKLEGELVRWLPQ